ncbi:DoxX family membrane protein, partial [Rhodococcus hoagii]|nr:DoxX family membrane protein [Prescottella equi]
LGVIFIAHGWQKSPRGASTAPRPPSPAWTCRWHVSAIVAATIELVGGIALLVGFATRGSRRPALPEHARRVLHRARRQRHLRR